MPTAHRWFFSLHGSSLSWSDTKGSGSQIWYSSVHRESNYNNGQIFFTVLGSVCIWMSEEAVKAHMPKEFQDYPDTQVVIDCTELRCQTPSSLLLQSEVFSSYKSHCTFKGLIAMAPHGAVTFVSSLYAGSISDKELLKQSGIVSLLKPDMAIMVDKGFLVDDCVPCKVYRPAYLSKGNICRLMR